MIGGVMGALHATIDVSDEVTLEKTRSEWRLSTAFCSVRDSMSCLAEQPVASQPFDDARLYGCQYAMHRRTARVSTNVQA